MIRKKGCTSKNFSCACVLEGRRNVCTKFSSAKWENVRYVAFIRYRQMSDHFFFFNFISSRSKTFNCKPNIHKILKFEKIWVEKTI